MSACTHKNLSHKNDSFTVDYCPKGCDGEVVVVITVFCRDCKEVIYEISEGHDGCKYS